MSREEEFFEEGCLSFPAIYADVKRPVGVKVEYWDLQVGFILYSVFLFVFDLVHAADDCRVCS